MNNKKNVHMLSNTHWDREWYMSLEKYRVRLVKMMDRLVKVMEEKPEYQFTTDGQYMVIKDYLDVKPEMEDRVKALVREGRLHVGPWYTQPLETLITGEAMVRNLLYGIKESKKLGGFMPFSYMVDEFGHASQTPQVLQGFNIDHALAWRGMKKNTPDVFNWNSPDGSSVYMHYSRHGYGEATAMPTSMEDFEEVIDGQTFKRGGLKTRIERIKDLKEKNPLTQEFFWLNGIDHSWAQENILEVIEQINENFPEYNVRASTPNTYGDAYIEACKANNIVLEERIGELMDPYEATLQSTHTARVDQKIEHYHSERILEKKAEPLATMGWLCGMEYPKWAIDKAWTSILENHAHDSLGCTSVDSVYKQVMARYDTSIALSEQIIRDSATHLMRFDTELNKLYLFNTTAMPCKGDIYGKFLIPTELGLDNFKLVAPNGDEVPYSIIDKKTLKDIRYNAQYGHTSGMICNEYTVVMQVNLPADIGVTSLDLIAASKEGATFSLNAYDVVSGDRQSSSETLTPEFGIMENEHIKVEINPNGTMNLLYKKTGKQYRNLLLLEDSGDTGNFYLHTRPNYNKIITNLGAQAEISLLYDEALYCEYEIKYVLHIPACGEGERRSNELKATPVKINVKLLKNNPRVDVKIEVDNHSTDHQMRVLFPTQLVEATKSRSGQPFDIVERAIKVSLERDIKNNPSYSCYPMQDFCDVSEEGNGLSLAAKGIFEYEAMENRENALALTLFKATEYIDRGTFGNTEQFDARLGMLFKKLSFEISILPHDGDFKENYIRVMNYIAPPMVMFKTCTDEQLLPYEEEPVKQIDDFGKFIEFNGQHCTITGIKKAEDRNSVIIRVWNYSEEVQQVKMSIPTAVSEIKNIYKVNYNEDRIEALVEGNSLNIMVNPHQVVALEFEQ